MNLTTTPTPTSTSTPTTTTPDTDNDTPPHEHTMIKPMPISYSNGIAKKHHHFHHHLLLHPQPPFLVVVYKECLKNHAATLGGHALDGCGEFMPSPTTNPSDPTSLKCAACGCHRNFHRREPDPYSPPAPQFIDFRHPKRPSLSPSPPPPPPNIISYPPHMLLGPADSTPEVGLTRQPQVTTPVTPTTGKIENVTGRKRFRSRFTYDQKEKMYKLADKIGWKMQRSDDSMVENVCKEIGVARGTFKVWMHNNKHTLGKRDTNDHMIVSSTNGTIVDNMEVQNDVGIRPEKECDINRNIGDGEGNEDHEGQSHSGNEKV